MYCNKCGTKINNGNFCSNCGNQVNNINNYQQPTINNNYQQPPVQSQPMERPQLINNQSMMQQPTINSNYQQPINNNSNRIDSRMPINNNKQDKPINIVACAIAITVVIIFMISSSDNKKSSYIVNNDYERPRSTNENIPTTSNDKEVEKEKTVVDKTKRVNNAKRTVVKMDAFEKVNVIKSDEEIKTRLLELSDNYKRKCPDYNRELEKKMSEELKISSVNFCELEPSLSKDIYDVFKYYWTEFPMLVGTLDNVKMVNNDEVPAIAAKIERTWMYSEKVIRYYGAKKSSIGFVTEYFYDIEKLQKDIKTFNEKGYFAKNTTIKSIVAHEIGHHISFLTALKANNLDQFRAMELKEVEFMNFINEKYEKNSLDIVKTAYEKYKKENNTSLSMDEWRGKISKYALARDANGKYIYDETIAESFNDVYSNKEKANIASRYIYDEVIRRLKG